MEYITIENNIITGHFFGTKPSKRYGVEIIEVTNWFGVIGDDIRIYDTKTWLKKPLTNLVKDGVITVPQGKKISDSDMEFVAMSETELVAAGLTILPPDQKIDGNKIVFKTQQELFNDGVINSEQYNNWVDDMRKAAYTSESDPIYMQTIRGEAEYSEWIEKIAEIKRRYPKV